MGLYGGKKKDVGENGIRKRSVITGFGKRNEVWRGTRIFKIKAIKEKTLGFVKEFRGKSWKLRD